MTYTHGDTKTHNPYRKWYPNGLSVRRRKVTPQQVTEIRYRRFDGESVKDLALEYGITASYIRASMSPLERP